MPVAKVWPDLSQCFCS